MAGVFVLMVALTGAIAATPNSFFATTSGGPMIMSSSGGPPSAQSAVMTACTNGTAGSGTAGTGTDAIITMSGNTSLIVVCRCRSPYVLGSAVVDTTNPTDLPDQTDKTGPTIASITTGSGTFTIHVEQAIFDGNANVTGYEGIGTTLSCSPATSDVMRAGVCAGYAADDGCPPTMTLPDQPGSSP